MVAQICFAVKMCKTVPDAHLQDGQTHITCTQICSAHDVVVANHFDVGVKLCETKTMCWGSVSTPLRSSQMPPKDTCTPRHHSTIMGFDYNAFSFKWNEKWDGSQANAAILTTRLRLHCCSPDTFGTRKIRENKIDTPLTKGGNQYDSGVFC